jgi:tRNA(fMet)-specific endonuclease VapC
MSQFVLDTDILSLFQRGDAAVHANIARNAVKDITITVITVEEQLSGWYSLIRQAKSVDKLAHAYHQLATTVPILCAFNIVSFNKPSIFRFDALRKLKVNIRSNDLRIAAIVLEIGATLVTRNARDFQQIPGVNFVDWSK